MIPVLKPERQSAIAYFCKCFIFNSIVIALYAMLRPE